KDRTAQFWRAYAQVAKEYDEEFLEKHNTRLDIHLIFAGLFSAVSSAFIVDMLGDLKPDPTDLTNALLMALLQANGTHPIFASNSTISGRSGPSTIQLVAQVFGYASLATSLLSAFGAVLGKQW
ncbi:hypothetical protein M422DRAFT_140403, partial [Sphaerobolus stellatus SS14]